MPAGTKTKAPSATTIAKLRRGGATWAQVREETGSNLRSSGFAEILEAAGFDRLGRKGGKGTSKARGWESKSGNGSKPKGKARPTRTKARVKKSSRKK
jgi:hypothetical protein